MDEVDTAHPFTPRARPGCPQCRTPAVAGASYCGGCGHRLPDRAAPEARSRRLPHRTVAAVALLACLAGLAALLLPVAEAAHGAFSIEMIDVPYVGVTLAVVLGALTLLPVVDLLRGNLRWTAWLCLPAVVGLVPVALAVLAVAELPHLLRLIWSGTPEWAVEAGSAPAVFAGSDVALLALGVLAVGARIASRRRRVRAPEIPSTTGVSAPALAAAAVAVPEQRALPRGGSLRNRVAGLTSPESRARAGRELTRGSAHVLSVTSQWSGRAGDRLRSRLATAGPAGTPVEVVGVVDAADDLTEPFGMPVVRPRDAGDRPSA